MKHIYFCLKNILAKQIIKMFLFDKSKEHLPCCMKFSIIWSTLILVVGLLVNSKRCLFLSYNIFVDLDVWIHKILGLAIIRVYFVW